MNTSGIVVDASVLLGAAVRCSDAYRIRFWMDSADHVFAVDTAQCEFAEALRKMVLQGTITLHRSRKLSRLAFELVDEYVAVSPLLDEAMVEAINCRVDVAEVVPAILARKLNAGYLSMFRDRIPMVESLGVRALW